jgi:hypothetical protein
MELRTAQRKRARIRLGLNGPSGSGKTYSALLLAYGLTGDWSKIAVIDSEQGSSDLYQHLGSYNVLTLSRPFPPERYIDAIGICEKAGMEVIIIDSISHEWEGVGGILDIHGNMPGNSFTNWAKLTPRHNAFIQRILLSPAHIISTMRVKQDYVLSERNGKMVPEKVGLKGITRDGTDYELTLVFDLDIKHSATASKDRTGLFVDRPPFVISPETGNIIKEWCSRGTGIEEVKHQVMTTESLDELRNLWQNYPEFRIELEPLMYNRKAEIINNRHVLTN